MAIHYQGNLQYKDYERLIAFKNSLRKLLQHGEIQIFEIGSEKLMVPTWHESESGLRFSALLEAEKLWIGIPQKDMHKVCADMRINPKDLLGSFYCLGSLAVIEGDEKPRKYLFYVNGFQSYILERLHLIKSTTLGIVFGAPKPKPPLRVVPTD